MIITITVLKMDNSEYDILRFNQTFQRDVDIKGRPCSVYYGGEIYVQFASTDNIQLFRKMIHEDVPTIDGVIEVFSGSDDVCAKRIVFKEAYVYSYGEDIQCVGWTPTTTDVMISPMRLDYNTQLYTLLYLQAHSEICRNLSPFICIPMYDINGGDFSIHHF